MTHVLLSVDIFHIVVLLVSGIIKGSVYKVWGNLQKKKNFSQINRINFLGYFYRYFTD